MLSRSSPPFSEAPARALRARITPFHRALIEPRLLMGIDRSLLGLLVIASMGLTVATKALWPLVVCGFVGAVLRTIFASDPLYMAVYGGYSLDADEYHP